jgi:hypothetical protein
MLEAYGRNTLLKNNEFLKRYSLVTVLDTEIYGSEGMLIYRRSR